MRKTLLEGTANHVVHTAFHPLGNLLASNGSDSQLRLWDLALNRPLLTLRGAGVEFSRDGRIALQSEGRLTTYQVDPALESRTLIHASESSSTSYTSPCIRHDGRILAVGNKEGVVLWDLAHGTELVLLPIGRVGCVLFEASGALLTNGSYGIERWPIRLDVDRGELRIGPPCHVSLRTAVTAVAEDRQGRVVAAAGFARSYVLTPERTFQVEPLDECRSVAVSADGTWLATGSPQTEGVTIWRVSDGARVATLPVDEATNVCFSPDGKWLAAGNSQLGLWEVGTWRTGRRMSGSRFGSFSPDGRLLVVEDATKVIRLEETETGRTLARLEGPHLDAISGAAFTPDGSRLVVTTNERPAVHVWDLRAIRGRLTEMGLDWHAPPYPVDDAAGSSSPLLARIQLTTMDDVFAEATKLVEAGLWHEAAAAYARSMTELTPEYPYYWCHHAILRLAVGDAAGYRSACQHMCDMFRDTDKVLWMVYGAYVCALTPDEPDLSAQAVPLAEKRFAYCPDSWTEYNLGLALYRTARFSDAKARLMSNLQRDPAWDFHILDWVVLAMTEYKLGQYEAARRWLDQADRWVARRLPGRPGGVDRAVPEGWSWDVAVVLHLQLREAHALFGASLPDLPTHIFGPP